MGSSSIVAVEEQGAFQRLFCVLVVVDDGGEREDGEQ